MGWLRRWWRNENYGREDMAAFRLERTDWADLPDEVVAQSFAFQAFALGRSTAELGGSIREEFEAFMERHVDRRLRALSRYFNGEDEGS